MFMFLARTTLTSFIIGCECAIAIYTGKTPLKFLKSEVTNDKNTKS